LKLEKLEAVRGLAAIYVVFHHAVPHNAMLFGFNISLLFRFGQEAVILFFLLSGFVINFAFQRSSDHTFRTYFLKRASRIYIPLLIVMLLGWIIECFRTGGLADPQLRALFLNLFMLQDVSSLKPNVIVDPYMNNSPLWSLSYEWWFYMLYFPIQKYMLSDKGKDLLVFGVAIVAALVYLYSPTFLPRLLMYMSIWWFGVVLSNLYMHRDPITIKALVLPLSALAAISLLNGVGVYRALVSGTYASIGVHPALELRHHLFAMVVVVLAVFWRARKWVLFDKIIAPFLFFAPMSYVVYISHFYLVVNADYLSFLDNSLLENILYIEFMFVFAYVVEDVIYPPVQRAFLKLTMAPKPRMDSLVMQQV
jgi:peptidoglycan/LPS O-acetylase OafA/YrhL